VDIFVEKPLLTARAPCNHAGFNKLPVQTAEFPSFKIKELQNQPNHRENFLQVLATTIFVHKYG
jgi:hypothetical protein